MLLRISLRRCINLIILINYFRVNYDESVSTLKFADRAKSVLTKVKPNEIMAYDEDLINKLTKEINSLKEILSIRKKRGTYGEIEDQFTKLKEENERLKKYVLSNLTDENIEKLLSENKNLKLELQKFKSKNSESSQDGSAEADTGNNYYPYSYNLKSSHIYNPETPNYEINLKNNLTNKNAKYLSSNT